MGPQSYICDAAARVWAPWLAPGELETLRRGGYYATLIAPGLRFVAVNTVFYMKADRETAADPDPAGQLAWLETVLRTSAEAGERVYLAGHVPPGCYERWVHRCLMTADRAKRFLSIVAKYAKAVVAQFYGHYHSDTFRIAGDGSPPSSFAPTSVLFIAPALTPWSIINNPAIRQFRCVACFLAAAVMGFCC